MLDLHRLRVFRSVVASGSVQAAATNLGYTPSAVSQHIAALQRETGLTLVSRAGRGIQPTRAGHALAAHTDDVLTRISAVESFVADLRAGRTGSLSIAYFASVGAAWLPHVVRTLMHSHPGVRLDLELRENIPQDPSERADLQIVVEHHHLEPTAGVTAHLLLEDPYVAVLPRAHTLADRDELDLVELVDERWVDNDFSHGWCRQALLEGCLSAGFTPTFHIEAHDYPTAIAFVDAGIGITVLPALGAANLPPGVVSVPVVSPTPVRSIYALASDSIADSPPAMAALDALKEVAGTAGKRLTVT